MRARAGAGYPESGVVQQLMQYWLSDVVQGNLSAYGASPLPPAYVSHFSLLCWTSCSDTFSSFSHAFPFGRSGGCTRCAVDVEVRTALTTWGKWVIPVGIDCSLLRCL